MNKIVKVEKQTTLGKWGYSHKVWVTFSDATRLVASFNPQNPTEIKVGFYDHIDNTKKPCWGEIPQPNWLKEIPADVPITYWYDITE